MKNYLSIVILLFLGLSLNAQAPQGFNYQATVRNASGDLIVNQNVFFKFNIIQGTQTAIPTYTEQHYVPTDDLGQVSLVIGQGTPTTGVFSELDWSQGSFYLGIELDTGNGYVAMGTTQLLSVPYALYAENSGNAETSTPSLESVLEVNNSANNQKITNLLNPTSDQDAATKYYVDDEINNSSQTLEQVLSNGNNASGLQIKGLANPTDPQDAVNLEVLNNQINFLQNQLTDIYQNLVDGDGDGFTPGAGDCDDSNPLVYPDAIEICDGIDNNCDGIIDGNPETEYFADIDGDGYGNSMSSVLACSQPIGYVTDNTDCDDANALVFPGADEICDNIDNNCNNLTDEGITPTVVSVTGNPLTTNSIYVEAQLYDDCISQISSYGFVYSSTEQIPSLNTGSIEVVGQDYQYEFNAQISGLLPSTNYYVRAYATNEFGTTYGNVLNVETDEGIYFNITSPSLNEEIDVNITYSIEWNSNLDNEQIVVQHYRGDQFISDLGITYSSTNSFQWEIDPELLSSSNNKIKILNNSNLEIISESEIFTINEYLQIISPSENQNFLNNNLIISFSSNFSSNFSIELYNGSQFIEQLENSVSSSSNFSNSYDVSNLTLGSDYRIKLIDNNSSNFIFSNYFNLMDSVYIDERDGNSYNLVSIGTQIWMAEDLRLSNPSGAQVNWFQETSDGSYVYHPSFLGNAVDWDNNIYVGGTLAPEGWRVATDLDWQILEMELGMSSSSATQYGDRVFGEVGLKLKSTQFGGTNSYGFNINGFNGGSDPKLYMVNHASVNQGGMTGIVRRFSFSDDGVGRYLTYEGDLPYTPNYYTPSGLGGGYHVRLIKDE